MTPAECEAVLAARPSPGPPRSQGSGPTLSATEVCGNAGYLCATVEQEGSLRLLRWPEETPLIRVWVPEPPDPEPAAARALQRAAVQGIQAWDGHPFPLSIRTRDRGETPDVTVEWVPSLGGNRLGRAEIRWVREGDEIRLQVLALRLSTRYPGSGGREMTPGQVRLVAAHEMGHALGLPHSDDPRDVMYPENSATSLSAQDYRTLEALYRLPNGAEIRR